MKNNSFVFCNSHLTTEAEELEKVGKDRFKSLDAFNADVKTLTRLLARFAVPDIGWVRNPDEYMQFDKPSVQIGWHDETVVYCDGLDTSIASALPIYEAPAAVRWEIAKAGLLFRLLRTATCVVKDKQAEEIIAQTING